MTPSVPCVVKWPSNLRGGISPQSFRNIVTFILSLKWVTKINVGLLIFVWNVCETSYSMGKSFKPNAFRRPHRLEGTM